MRGYFGAVSMTTHSKMKTALQNALERGRQSVRDETDGNPYAPKSDLYDQFELGIVRQQHIIANRTADNAAH